jgi:hypothetical protein
LLTFSSLVFFTKKKSGNHGHNLWTNKRFCPSHQSSRQ